MTSDQGPCNEQGTNDLKHNSLFAVTLTASTDTKTISLRCIAT